MKSRTTVVKILFASEDFFGEESAQLFVQLWDTGGRVPRTSSAVLTPEPRILDLYDRWIAAYRNQDTVEGSSAELVNSFNDWLTNQPSFRDGVENWLREQFNPDDEIRVAIESDDPNIRKLPWQSWSLLERFDCAEVSVGDTRQGSCSTASIAKEDTTRILAIVDYDSDPGLTETIAAIAALPNLQVECLTRPTTQQVEATLRDSRWDVLYFSNCPPHSPASTPENASAGPDSEASLSLSQLRGALRQAVKIGGLQIGLFNLTDGLHAIDELTEVRFPLSIAMREPAPEQQSRQFLYHFLQAYSRGKRPYLAFRHARHLLERDIWLPVIAHNTATSSLLWQDFDSLIVQTAMAETPLTKIKASPSRDSSDPAPPLPNTIYPSTIYPIGTSTVLRDSYEIVRNLGSGGFSMTYLGKMLRLPEQPFCTIKQFQPNNPNIHDLALKLFKREVQTLFDLGNKTDRIPALYDYFEEKGEFYLVQEFIDGEELEKELRRRGQLTEPETLQLLGEILEALEVVHRQGIIHRDIKPSNLMRRRADGKIVLIDFGAVKEAATMAADAGAIADYRGTIIGTPGFMPPEQSVGCPQHCSDIFAVGAIALLAMTGRVPEQSISAEGKTGGLIRRDDASLSAGMKQLLDRLTSEAVEQRLANATDALAAVNELKQAFDTGSAIPSSLGGPLAPADRNIAVVARDTVLQTWVGRQAIEQRDRAKGWMARRNRRFVLGWMLASMAVPLTVIVLTEHPNQGFFGLSFPAILSLLAVAGSQALIIRTRLKDVALRWAAMTGVGAITASILYATLLFNADNCNLGICDDAPSGAIAFLGLLIGAVFGSCQWVAIKDKVERSHFWLAGTVVGILVGLLIAVTLFKGSLIRSNFDDNYLQKIGFYLIWLGSYSIVSGSILDWMLNHSGGRQVEITE
ncbi:MAG: serine/threonine-protein kinase [Cyanobacteria bacterium P01_A01_bin.3]